MRATQFGFRKKQGCADAPLALRIILERIAKISDYAVTLLFLPWKKAFDSATRDAVKGALRVRGVPDEFRAL